jgi:hypothetical protein
MTAHLSPKDRTKSIRFSTAFSLITSLSIIGLWVNLLGYSPLFLEAIIDSSYYTLGRCVHFWGQLIIAILGLLFYRFFEKHIVFLSAIASIVLCVATSLTSTRTPQELVSTKAGTWFA